jgi:hypothetical protein
MIQSNNKVTISAKPRKTSLTPIGQNMVILGAAFPQIKVSRESVEVYKGKLRHIPAVELAVAIHSWIERERFFPSIADLLKEWRITRPVRLALVDRTEKSGTPEERRAHIEWAKEMVRKLKLEGKGMPGMSRDAENP